MACSHPRNRLIPPLTLPTLLLIGLVYASGTRVPQLLESLKPIAENETFALLWRDDGVRSNYSVLPRRSGDGRMRETGINLLYTNGAQTPAPLDSGGVSLLIVITVPLHSGCKFLVELSDDAFIQLCLIHRKRKTAPQSTIARFVCCISAHNTLLTESMSTLLSFGMAGSKKEKHYANSRARRHSDIVITHGKKSKKDKDTDTDSTTSSSNSTDVVVVPPPPEKKCPLRFMLAGMMETDSEEKKPSGCPLRRVQLWHVIPLCLLAIVNLLLVIIALVGLAGYRITIGIQSILVSLVKTDLEYNPYAESFAGTDDGTLVDKS